MPKQKNQKGNAEPGFYEDPVEYEARTGEEDDEEEDVERPGPGQQRRTAGEITDDIDDDIIRGHERDFNNMEVAMAAGMTLFLFGTAAGRLANFEIRDIEEAAAERAARNIDVLINTATGGGGNPLTPAPPWYIRSGVLSGSFSILSDWLQNIGTDIRGVLGAGKELMGDTYQYLQGALNHFDGVGQFGYHEGYIQGGLAPLAPNAEYGIPWTTCEDNNNCSSDAPVCDVCQGLSGVVFTADEWLEPAHDKCRCNEPLAKPVLITAENSPQPELTNDQLYVPPVNEPKEQPLEAGQTTFDSFTAGNWKEET